MAQPEIGKGGYTYGDYLGWPDDARCELIDGVLYDMSPAPARRHQGMLMELAGQFRNFLRGKPCRAYFAPFDIRLPREDEPDEEIRTVVQPDLAVVCDEAKLDEKGCRGAPDLVIEILSPSTSSKDQLQKLDLYERHGVREYWIVDPEARLIRAYRLGPDGMYGRDRVFSAGDRVSVGALEGMEVDATAVFEQT